MRHCERYEVLVSALLDGELSDGERCQLETHLADCAWCGAYLADQRAIWSALRELDAPAPEDFAEGVMARVRAESRREPGRRAVRLHWKHWAVAAACLALAVVGLWWSGLGAGTEDGIATMRSAGPGTAAIYSLPQDQEGLVPGTRASEGIPSLDPEEATGRYARILTTASGTAVAWVEGRLGTRWLPGEGYVLTAEEYDELWALLTEAGEYFAEETDATDVADCLLVARSPDTIG